MSDTPPAILSGYPLAAADMQTILTVDGTNVTGYAALSVADKKKVLSAFTNTDVVTAVGGTVDAANQTAIRNDIATAVLAPHNVTVTDYIKYVTTYTNAAFRALTPAVQANLVAALGEQDAQLVLTTAQASGVANVLVEMNAVITGEADLAANLATYPLTAAQMTAILTVDGLDNTGYAALTIADKKTVLSAFTNPIVTANITGTISAANETAIKNDIATVALASYSLLPADYVSNATAFNATTFKALSAEKQGDILGALGEQDAQVLLTQAQIAGLPAVIAQITSIINAEPEPLPTFDPIGIATQSPTTDAYFKAKADTFEALCTALRTALSAPQTAATKQAAGKAMTQILAMLASVNTDWIFDRYLAFYKASYMTILSADNAFTFMSAMSNGAQNAHRVVHTIFYALCAGEKQLIDAGKVKTNTHIMDLVSWVDKQKA